MALTVAFALTFTLTACGGQTPTSDDTTEDGGNLPGGFENEVGAGRAINLGFEGGLCQAAIPLAHVLGYFEDEGLNSEIVITGDLVSSRDALAAGNIDTVAGMLAGWFVPVTQGMDIRFVQGLHTGCSSAFVLADADISALEAGQTVAVSGAIGGAFHNIALRFAYRAGLTPDDLDFRDFPAAEAVAALQQGDVQVAVIPDQVGQRFVQEGTLKVIRSLTDADFAADNCCVLGLAGSFIDENPETSERIARAIFRASQFINESDDNKTQALNLLIEHEYISSGIDVEYMVGLMGNWRWGVPHDLVEQTLFTSIDEYQAMGVISPALAPADIQSQVWYPLGIDE